MKNKIEKTKAGRPREFEDGDVLQRAAEAFLRDGFEAASYEQIAQAMGLSKPSLYNAFGNKAELFERVITDYAQQAHGYIVSSFSNERTLERGTQKLFHAAAEFYSRPDDPSIGCLLIGTALPATTQYDAIRKILSEFVSELECAINDVIISQYSSDVERIGKTSAEMASHISSLIFALAVRARTGLSRPELLKIAKSLAANVY